MVKNINFKEAAHKKKGEEKILIREIPIIVTLGDLCLNVSMAYDIMVAIHEGRTDEAFNLANDLLNRNDQLAEAQAPKEKVKRLLNMAEGQNN